MDFFFLKKMGAWASTPELLPETLPADVVQAILERTPTSVLLDKALLVSKKWNEIGRRNVIWIPRYEKLTGETLDPVDYDEYQVFGLFLDEWYQSFQVWTSNRGKNLERINVPPGMSWIDTEIPLNQDHDGVLGKDIAIINDEVIALPEVNKNPFRLGETYVLITTRLRRPELLKITRKWLEPTRLEFVPSDAPYLVHDMDNLDLLGAKLGSGGYNRVVTDLKDPEKTVWRVSSAYDETSRKFIVTKRGSEIVDFLQSYESLLGPCLIQVREKTQIIKKAPIEMAIDLNGIGSPYLVQKLERLDTKFPTELTQSNAFLMIWFFYVGRTHFALRHGDLKRDNVAFRKVDKPMDLTFKLGQDKYYSIRIENRVPVVLDYDFASVFVTREKMFQVGTPPGSPPEAIDGMLRNSKGYSTPYLDWWAVGIVLMKMCNVPSPDQKLMEKYTREAQSVTTSRGYWYENGIPSLFTFSWYHVLIDSPQRVPKWSSPYYSGECLNIINDIQPPKQNPLTNWQKKLFRRLLSWETSERDYNGNPYKLITDHFPSSSSFATKEDYSYPIVSDVYFPRDESIRREMEAKYEQLKQLVY